MRAYISGALTNVDLPKSQRLFYEEIGKICVDMGIDVYLPHEHTDPLTTQHLRLEDIYRKDLAEVKSSDIIIACVSIPSLGVGIELGWADSYNKPTIIIYDDERATSRLARGLATAEIKFQDFEQLKIELRGHILTMKDEGIL